jgi:hypothetical protein
VNTETGFEDGKPRFNVLKKNLIGILLCFMTYAQKILEPGMGIEPTSATIAFYTAGCGKL